VQNYVFYANYLFLAHPLKGILRKLNIGIYEFEVSVIRWSWFVGFFDAFAK